jgi:hypothetical protein
MSKLVLGCVERVCLQRFLDISDTAFGEEFVRKLFAHRSQLAGDQ